MLWLGCEAEYLPKYSAAVKNGGGMPWCRQYGLHGMDSDKLTLFCCKVTLTKHCLNLQCPICSHTVNKGSQNVVPAKEQNSVVACSLLAFQMGNMQFA